MTISVAMGAAAGSSPPAAVVQGDSRDDGAVIFCGTDPSSTPGAGVYATITLSGNYSATAVDDPAIPKFFVTYGYPSAAAAASGLYLSSASTRQLVISAQAAVPINLPASGSGITIIFKMEG